jgi:large conductance mechanosensitive channel
MLKSFLAEFKEFAMRGNALDMAVGIILGAAFGTIVSSLVDDVIMPPIGLVLGGVDFSNIFLNLSGQDFPSYAAAKEAGAPVIGIGNFLNQVINFLIVAFAVFLLIKNVNRFLKFKQEEPAPPPPAEVQLLTEIRDLLKNGSRTLPGTRP